MSDKLEHLMVLCKCAVTLSINEHRVYYESVERRLDEHYQQFSGGLSISPEVRQKMIETDTIIELDFYPDTPVGSCTILHYDLEAALDEALDYFRQRALMGEG